MKLWTVYKMTINEDLTPVSAVCEQREWQAMERAHPGRRRLIQDGITSEAEAERLARGQSLASKTF